MNPQQTRRNKKTDEQQRVREALRTFAPLLLAHDPRELALLVEDETTIMPTRESVRALQRWFTRYSAALRPGVQ